MPTRRQAPLQFDALSIEGGLFPAEWLGRVAALGAPDQSPADYGVPRGLQLRDEIGRYWRIAEAIWGDFAAARTQLGHDAIGASRTLVRQLLKDVFGFTDLAPGGDRVAGARRFPVTFEAAGGRVPLIVGPATEELDLAVARHGDGARRRSAWGALQEYLNAAEGALWGIASNGVTIRLGRDNASLTRPAWLEADLERIFGEERFADFSVLWLTLHASRFGRTDRPADESPLEAWRAAAREEGSRARKDLRIGVEQALLELGQGFVGHPANVALREELAAGALTPAAYFNELLRLVYRMIFLLTVEERGILHAPGAPAESLDLYARGYGLRRLRERALRRAAHDRHGDLWESLKPVWAGLGRADGEPALGLPGLGGLFAPEQCAHLDAAALENRALLGAVFRLAWLRDGRSLTRVNWKDMGPEELGSVYESLLELVPKVSEDGRRFEFAGAAESAGNARKLTGSYYTPDALVQQLLDTALEPVVAQRVAAQPADPARAILSIAVVDPACGSGHFLLAAARRLAGHLARVRVGGTPGAAEYRHALRDVVTHCIHGVDRNPMALELARMALWLEAYTPDRALGFLDHHLVCGDALLGLLDLGVVRDGIPDEAFKALTGDSKEVARELARRNREARRALERTRLGGQHAFDFGTGTLGPAFAELDSLEDYELDDVAAKRERYRALHAEAAGSRVALAADCYLTAFLSPKSEETKRLVPTTGELNAALDGTLLETHSVAKHARVVCRGAHVLHWPLAFPQVFARGGFDVVLGNPPWEVSQLSEEEFFTSRAPEIAALPGARRKAAIAGLSSDNPVLWGQYVEEKFRFEAANTAYRGNPRFSLTGSGRTNTYALFAETVYRITEATGRAGLVIPTGIATDDSTKNFFSEIVKGRLHTLFDFRTGPGLFADIGHQRYKFCLLTLGRASLAEFAFFMTDVRQLTDSRRHFALTESDFRLINPNTLNCPTFRTRYDAELTKAIYLRVPVLIDETKSGDDANPWRLSFSQGLFNMTSDSGLFLDASASDRVPLYEGKTIHQFDHRWATYQAVAGAPGGVESRDVTDGEKADPGFSIRPRYWVRAREVEESLLGREWTRNWLMGWRDICRATDERTVIASVLPRVGVGNKLPLMYSTRRDTVDLACLLADQNSIVHDYVARQKVGGTNLTFFIMRQIATLPPRAYGAHDKNFIVPRVLELSYSAYDITPWARDLGYDGPPFVWNPERRALLRAELDAYYAHLYGLTRDELRYVLDPADVMGPDFPSETFRVLKQNEEKAYGEYRTRRLVLEAWDRLFGGDAAFRARRSTPGTAAVSGGRSR